MNVIQLTDRRGDVWAKLKPSVGVYQYRVGKGPWTGGFYTAEQALDAGERELTEIHMQEGAISG